MAIGLAHDQLSFKKSASSVNMRDYLKALCANIDPRRPEPHDRHGIRADKHPARPRRSDRPHPERVGNQLGGDAFDEEGGVINVTFRLNETIGEAELCVRDNGRGMGPARSGSLGLRLVEGFSRQLGGWLTTPEVPKGRQRVPC